MTLGFLLWLVMLVALGLGSVSVPASGTGLLGVFGLAILLWSVPFFRDLFRNRDRPEAQAVGLVGGVLIGFGGLELIGLLTAVSDHQPEQAAWFGSALGFASVGLISARRAEPSDRVLSAQISLHLVLSIPALGGPMNQGLRWLAGAASAETITDASGLVRTLILIVTVLQPPLFLLLLAVLGLEASDPSRENSTPFWTALLVGEAAVVVLLFRWGVGLSI